MPLLIDGYNLLHATDVFPKGRGRHSLRRARTALLSFLSQSLSDDERPLTTIVFDAKDAPPGLPREESVYGMKVYFAAHHAEADDLIEELIRAETSPRRLTVVSSDHRIQRAARRRKATAIDSDQWYANTLRQLHEREQDTARDFSKPTLPLEEEDVQSWLSEFGDVESQPQDPEQFHNHEPSLPGEKNDSSDHDVDSDEGDLWNPFPPGYAEDLLDEDDDPAGW